MEKTVKSEKVATCMLIGKEKPVLVVHHTSNKTYDEEIKSLVYNNWKYK